MTSTKIQMLSALALLAACNGEHLIGGNFSGSDAAEDAGTGDDGADGGLAADAGACASDDDCACDQACVWPGGSQPKTCTPRAPSICVVNSDCASFGASYVCEETVRNGVGCGFKECRPGTADGGSDAGVCSCGPSSCGSRICGRSSCGYPCGYCASNQFCFSGQQCLLGPAPGTACTDAWGAKVTEGDRGFRPCPSGGDTVQACTCSGAGWINCDTTCISPCLVGPGDGGARIACGGSTCTGGLVCCRSVIDGGLACEVPTSGFPNLGGLCPFPSTHTSMACDSQDDCGAGDSCCGQGAASECLSGTSCGGWSRICTTQADCGGGENCCPDSSGPLKVCRSTSC